MEVVLQTRDRVADKQPTGLPFVTAKKHDVKSEKVISKELLIERQNDRPTAEEVISVIDSTQNVAVVLDGIFVYRRRSLEDPQLELF